jgi:NAD(P)-dependent dehydrogenase (short-subunit alcohol dehydrogenase family)
MPDQVALITGGATGIGAAVATQLAQQGVRVAICDVNQTDGEALADRLGARFFVCDVTSLASVTKAVAACIKALGVPDYAHLNAGIMTVPTGDPYLAIEDVSIEQYKHIVSVNLDGVYHGLKTLLPVMRSSGGAVTITASTAGLTLVPVDPMYTATKYALVGLTRAVAAANTGSNVRINAICPGVVDTGIVPDDFRKPEYGMMPAEVIAREIVDLLVNGENGEVRVKNNADRQAFRVEPPDLSHDPGTI